MSSEPGSQRIACAPQRTSLRFLRFEAVAVNDQRRQSLDLIACPYHRLVRVVQILEIAKQCANALASIIRLQHVATYEISEVTHRFH